MSDQEEAPADVNGHVENGDSGNADHQPIATKEPAKSTESDDQPETCGKEPGNDSVDMEQTVEPGTDSSEKPSEVLDNSADLTNVTEDKVVETEKPTEQDKVFETEDKTSTPEKQASPDSPDGRRVSVNREPPPTVAPKPKRPSSTVFDAPPPSVSSAPARQHSTQYAGHLSAEEMDQQRRQNIAYEYLCHLEESKIWIQACINEELPPTTELEEGLRNGVYLAKLAHFMAPTKVPLKRIYDKDQTKFHARGLHFRHTDNLNQWFKAMEEVGLPRIFYPETTDIYDRKNMPRTIYCLHALSLYLFKLGMAPQIEDLYGKVNFTEEEISAMRQELDKYGIQMPTFSKIGGILANELSQDDAALHAAIIAINEAIETQNSKEIMTALGNPSANLVGISQQLEGDYTAQLYEAKQTKTENSKNKKSGKDEGHKEFDVYDEMLTQAELQGHLNLVNTTHTLNTLNEALLKDDPDTVLKMLKSSHLGIKNVKDENIELYLEKLKEARQVKKNNNNGEDVPLDRDDIQQAVNAANLEADVEYQKSLAVRSINSALETSDQALLMKTLQHPKSQLPPVHEFAASLYMTEFSGMKEEKGAELDYDEIYGAVRVLSAIATINQCIDTGNEDGTLAALSSDTACIANLDEENAERYQNALVEAKTAKRGEACELLTHGEIQEIVDQVNTDVEEEQQRILAILKINEYIEKGVPEETLEMLKAPEAKLDNIDDKQAYHYQVLLVRRKKQKADKEKDENAELWVDEIQSSIDQGNTDATQGKELSMGVAAINDAVEAESPEALAVSLALPGVGMQNFRSDCAQTYLEELGKLKEKKRDGGSYGSGWMMNRVRDGTKFFFNTRSLDYLWCRTDDVDKDHNLLTKDEIQGVVTEVTDAKNREMLFEANEDFIIKVQSLARGYLARKRYRDRMSYLRSQEPSVVKIQAFWRGARQQKAYKERLNYFTDHTDATHKIQAMVRMWLVRRRFLERMKYFRDHEGDIVKIQAFVRSNKARHDYRALMHEENPPLSVVQRFVHLLDTSDADYAEELELQRVKQQVVKEIKSNQQLEHDLDQMDVKIGLLIKNRITLQDVVMLNKKLTKQRETSTAGGNRRSAALPKGLKMMSKESHDRMEAYQNLFYLLQTHPRYLAKLIFEMPQDRTTKFMESVIYSVFNYGSNVREEYLLAKLFKTALEEEITSKVEKITDIVTGNPLVIKMIVGFNRNQRGQNALKEILQPVVVDVIEDKNLKINTNPVEVYKVWVNQQESQTGVTSVLPYDVSPEEALKHPEVCEILRESTDRLMQVTDRFLNAILQSLDKIPYGMRYMAKVLKAALEKKFPETEEKDVLKIVGNLLYYRYINPAIVSPDAFDIINISVEKALTMDQRRNLGSVAKVLQFAAANKGFGGDSSYLSHMNPYIKDTHEKFKKYCLSACQVEEPELKFNIDQYTDVTMITKPVIYVSIGEIVDTHQLLLDHQDRIAPDNNDPLHELLEDLVEVPTGHELLGMEIAEDENLEEQIHTQLTKTEITLTLTNKFEVPEDDQTDIKTLLIRTKRMAVDVIACQSGDTLAAVLEKPATDEQEELHQALVKKRDIRDKRLARGNEGNIVRQQSMSGDLRLPLNLMKTKIKKSLQSLELENMVSRKDGYQEIINIIARDIRNQRRYRNTRKQELNRLRVTIKSLSEKRKFYESQVDYYNQYVKTCTENMKQKGRSKAKANKHARKAQGVIKYSGAKLHEKGVILEIEGLPHSQFKSAQFEIAATADPGVFEVSAKVTGIEIKKVELIFQDLLQLQYEGVAVMEMFGKTKINVNLLIFLINKKFYSGAK